VQLQQDVAGVVESDAATKHAQSLVQLSKKAVMNNPRQLPGQMVGRVAVDYMDREGAVEDDAAEVGRAGARDGRWRGAASGFGCRSSGRDWIWQAADRWRGGGGGRQGRDSGVEARDGATGRGGQRGAHLARSARSSLRSTALSF